MRSLIGIICVLAVSIASVAQPAHAQGSLPPQLVLRPSYFYVDVDPVSTQPLDAEPSTKSEPQFPKYVILPDVEARKRQERNRRIGIGVGVSLAIVAIGVGVGIPMYVRALEK